MIDNVLDLARPIALIYNDGNRTNSVRAEDGSNGVNATFEKNANAVTGPDAALRKSSCKGSGASAQLTEVHNLILLGNGRALGMPLRCIPKDQG